MYFVGIDAGGTKTDFLLCDEDKNEIKSLTLGAGNPNDIGIEACISLLSQGLDEVCGSITPNAVFAGVSGGGYGENAARIREYLQTRFPHSVVDNGTDALNLIYCSESSGTVGALICGTGTGIFIRKDGKLYRFGGWGHLFDNGGSAYDVGRDAISRLLLSEEMGDDASATPLCSLLLDRLGATAHEAINSFYKKGKSYIASFAPIVFEADSMGDMAARRIIESNVQTVAERLSYVKSTVGDVEEIICAGGLFKSKIFFELLSEASEIKLTLLDVPPVRGACNRAIALAGIKK